MGVSNKFGLHFGSLYKKDYIIWGTRGGFYLCNITTENPKSCFVTYLPSFEGTAVQEDFPLKRDLRGLGSRLRGISEADIGFSFWSWRLGFRVLRTFQVFQVPDSSEPLL